MNFDGKQMQEEFNEVFGELYSHSINDNEDYIETRYGNKLASFNINKLSPEMLWWLTKFAKHIRLRCRNNSAFNNYMNRNFPNATFREVTKTNSFGKTYQGLSIIVNGQEVSEEEAE